MSADNYYVIWKNEEDKYEIYMRFASCEYGKEKPNSKLYHIADTVEEAIRWCQTAYSEYGYIFLNLRRDNERAKEA